MNARRRFATLTATAAVAVVGFSGIAVSANAATAVTGPHNAYSHTHTVSSTGVTDTQKWTQYQTSTTYNMEEIATHSATTGAGYTHYILKWDVNGKWRQHETGWSKTAKGAVTSIDTWTNN
jgi:hypothetical protein